MDSAQASKAVFITGGVLVAAAFLENKYAKANQFPLYKRLWFIGLLVLVLSMTADFVPEVAGPLALLILVSVAVHDGKYFGLLQQENTTKKAGK